MSEMSQGVQSIGAVKRSLIVSVQPVLSEKTAVTVTGFPSAVRFVNVSVCGLELIAKD